MPRGGVAPPEETSQPDLQSGLALYEITEAGEVARLDSNQRLVWVSYQIVLATEHTYHPAYYYTQAC